MKDELKATLAKVSLSLCFQRPKGDFSQRAQIPMKTETSNQRRRRTASRAAIWGCVFATHVSPASLASQGLAVADLMSLRA